jgi:hypothetical protein
MNRKDRMIEYPVTEYYSRGWHDEDSHKVGKILFLRGVPRCGKSTFCNNWLKNYHGIPKVVISGDDFRLATYGQEYCHTAEAAQGLTVFAAIRALVKRHLVLYDETNSSEFSLRRIFEIDKHAQYVTFTMAWNDVMKINDSTSRIPIEVFDRISYNLQDIDPEEIRKDYV